MIEADIAKGLELLVVRSSDLSSVAFSVLAASVAAVVGTSYRLPTGYARKAYLLFVPGWVLLILSIWNGDFVARRHLSLYFFPIKEAQEFEDKVFRINDAFGTQQRTLFVGVGVFLAWLIVFLLWLVFKGDKDGVRE